MAEMARRNEAQRGAKARQDAETETEEGAGGAGYLPAHSTCAAEGTTKSDALQHCEYGKKAAVLVGGPDSAGPAPDKDGYGTTRHRQPHQEEGGDETPRRAREEKETADGETEEMPPPERSRTPNVSGRRGGEGRGGNPTQHREGPREGQRENPQ